LELHADSPQYFFSAIALIPFATAFLSDCFSRFYCMRWPWQPPWLLELYQWRYALKSGLTTVFADSGIAKQLALRTLAVPISSIAVILIWFIAPKFATIGFILIPILQKIIDRKYLEKNEIEE
jgi:uncharacterized membrane protein